MERIDRVVRAVVQNFGDRYFTKPEAMNLILRDTAIATILARLPRQWPGWQLDEIFIQFIEGRLTTWLQQTVTAGVMVDGPVKVRVYECYPVGDGPRRWRRLEAMTSGDLRVCIAARRVQVAGHLRVIRVYEALLAQLERIGPTARVGDVIGQALQELAASP